jgi:hypothetical protein
MKRGGKTPDVPVSSVADTQTTHKLIVSYSYV